MIAIIDCILFPFLLSFVIYSYMYDHLTINKTIENNICVDNTSFTHSTLYSKTQAKNFTYFHVKQIMKY